MYCEQQRIDRVHELEADLQAQLDTINGALEEAFREQRATMERRTSGKRKGGWSVTYGKILTNVKDLIAVAAAAVDANPSRTEELAQRMRELCKELEISIDCTGMTAAHAAGDYRRSWRVYHGVSPNAFA